MQETPKLNLDSRGEYPSSIRWLMVTGLFLLAAASAAAAFIHRDRIPWWTFALYGILLTVYLVAESRVYSIPPFAGRRAHQPLRYLLSIAWWALIVGSLGDAALWPVAHTAVTVFGAVIMAAGSILRIWSVSTLGSNFSGHIETWPDQTVVRAGPYRVLRHPGYAGNILQAIGLPLVVGAFGALPLAAVVIVLFLRRLLWEEEWLTENLPGYRDYRKETSRLLPGIW